MTWIKNTNEQTLREFIAIFFLVFSKKLCSYTFFNQFQESHICIRPQIEREKSLKKQPDKTKRT